MRSKQLTLLIAAFCVVAAVSAQKPKWVDNTPKELNQTYKFIEIISAGSDLSSARVDALHLLAQNQQLTKAVSVSVETGMLTHVEQTTENGKMNETITDNMDISVSVSGQEYKLQANKVDEYVEHGKRYGQLRLHTLFMVALCDNPQFDRTYLSTHYGAAPVLMSVIPGVGQWYKGSKVKGICLFAAEAAAVTGIIVCDNQRASYVKKMKEQPKFAQSYNNKADNWETSRNVCIGVAAGVWIYNLIDAAVAKGARRVVVKRADDGGLSLKPFAIPEAAGISLAYKF